MKLLPISATIFKGREIYYSSIDGEEGLKKNSGFYPNSTIEKTLGKDHSFVKNKAYFADPMEFVPQSIKDRVDFVVYDNEASYPAIEDVKKNYLENNRTNYREKFEDVRTYFYRREMGGFANIEEAKNEQRKAAECTGFYDRAGDLRYKKETTEDEVKALKSERAELQAGLDSTKKELEAQKEMNKSIEKHIKSLKTMQRPYEELNQAVEKEIINENIMYASAISRVNTAKQQEEYLKQLENSAYYNEGREAYPYDGPKYAIYENTTKTYEAMHNNMDEAFNVGKSKNAMKKQANILQKTIANFETILDENVKTIAEMQKYISDLKTKAADVDLKIKSRTAFIEECKAKLKPHFEALAKFYKENEIKVFKR